MTAIKAGILTPTTKAELETLERRMAELTKAAEPDLTRVDQLIEELPRAVERYQEMIADLANVTQRQVAKARSNIGALVGGAIRLVPNKAGYLDAEVAGDYAGLIALAKTKPGARAGLDQLSLVAGTRNHRQFTPVIVAI